MRISPGNASESEPLQMSAKPENRAKIPMWTGQASQLSIRYYHMSALSMCFPLLRVS